MARKAGRGGTGRGKRRLSTAKKGKGKAGGRWSHGFVPRNAVAKQLKAKTYRKRGVKSRRKKKR